MKYEPKIKREIMCPIEYGLDMLGGAESAKAYLDSEMFKNDVFGGLQPLWSAAPDVRIYTVA